MGRPESPHAGTEPPEARVLVLAARQEREALQRLVRAEAREELRHRLVQVREGVADEREEVTDPETGRRRSS